jgi:hypothetical protein
MYHALASLINRLDDSRVCELAVIPWSCPVPSFGDVSASRVATLGLNPSKREFVDALGKELGGSDRRLHTLRSLGLRSWGDAESRHLLLILEGCRNYFSANPYDRWFRKLDLAIRELGVSFYGQGGGACHLDLIPYATATKWIDLTARQRLELLALGTDILGRILRDSPVGVLVLNGRSVVQSLEAIAEIQLEPDVMAAWTLQRSNTEAVLGTAYAGVIDRVAGVSLGREILVLGYNHNLQSSFGVTANVIREIGNWIAASARERLQ